MRVIFTTCNFACNFELSDSAFIRITYGDLILCPTESLFIICLGTCALNTLHKKCSYVRIMTANMTNALPHNLLQ